MLYQDALLERLYGAQAAPDLASRVQEIVEKYRPLLPPITNTQLQGRLSERDAVLITYGDQVQEHGVAPLHALAAFCQQYLAGVVSSIHILPFFPYSSDDGFSVIDYRRVDPALGDWKMLAGLRKSFALMFDAVINHISSQSDWFQGFLQDNPKYREYFITVENAPDLSQVVRPRALPLLTPATTPSGPKAVWTTFSADQVDLNYANPAVLLEMIDLLLFYVSQGAELIRLDAIAYLWKEIGTSCLHLPQTHAVIRLFRAVLDQVAPYVFLITETNVPHQENITYFGDGYDEAQLVYNFALPPLTLHTFYSGSARAISDWASGLQTPSDHSTFFNFLASHDGIGINPVREILTAEEIHHIVMAVQEHGGLVSYKTNPDGSHSPYELNISYFDALSDPNREEPLEMQIRRFVTAHAILCALPGVPGVYFHSLLGSRSWADGVQETGRNRTINRQKFSRLELEQDLADPAGLRCQVFERIKRLLQARAGCRAFHPNGRHLVVDAGPGIFAMWRFAPEGSDRSSDRALCLHNVTGIDQEVGLDGFERPPKDLLRGRPVEWSVGKLFSLEPYQFAWLTL
jgi:sucrose phosphorylase